VIGALLATCACAILVTGLLVCERRGARRGVYVCKPAASVAFLGVAAAGALSSGGLSPYASLIVAGLIFGAAGDVALMLPGRRPFLVGLALFLLGHIAYVMACATLVSPSMWLSPVAAVPVAVALVALAWLGPHVAHEHRSMRVPVALYVAAITTMVIGALAVARAAPVPGLDAIGAYLLAVGASSFFVSDLAVARQRFVASGFINKLWGLPAYYAGQLLIAWTLAFTA
jgi:uncharacterized membrane protein YhhN